MLTLKYGNSLKVALVTLALAIALLVEPVLAKKSRSTAGKSSGTNSRTQRVQKTPAAPRVRSPSNVRRAAPATTPSRATKLKARSSNSRLLSRGTSRKTFNLSFRQPSRIITNRSTTTLRSKAVSRSFKPSRNTLRQKKSTGISSSAGKQATASSGNRISSSKTARIGKSIGGKRLAFTTTRQPARTNKPKTAISSSKTSRVGELIGEKKSRATVMRKTTLLSKPKISTDETSNGDSSKVLRKFKEIGKDSGTRTRTARKLKRINLKVVDKISAGSRLKKTVPGNRKTVGSSRVTDRTGNEIVNNTENVGNSQRLRSSEHLEKRGSFSTRAYDDHSHIVRRIHPYEHVYWDRHHRLCHRIVWPRYRFAVRYRFGSCFAFRYVYPYYHRRYVFVSLGGYWPIGYRYIRYYWYGYHPYHWYGYYPIAHEVTGDTYNYYTYNYNYADTAASETGQVVDGIEPVDHTTFADVREKLARQAEEPEPETQTDRYFDDGVKAFEVGHYDIAADNFARAIELAPDDMVLPFAYSQALFANEKYSEAVELLRTALAKVTPEKEGVFYPRGLYAKDDVLLEQIDRLAEKAELYSFDADLQLLLGYQLLGIGEIDKAFEPLQQAGRDLKNAAPAEVLLDLLEKIRTEKAEDASRKDTNQ